MNSITSIDRRRVGAWRYVLVAVCVALASLAAAVGAARAAGPLEVTAFDAGLSSYQAGGHPNATLSFDFATEPAEGPHGQSGGFCGVPCIAVRGGAPKDVVVDLPKGVYAAVQNVQTCTSAQFPRCPPDSQVGVVDLRMIQGGVMASGLSWRGAIFRLEPARGEVARFGFKVIAIEARMSVKLRSDGDYALRVESQNIFDGAVLAGADVTMWGVPSDPVNDHQRWIYGSGFPGDYGVPATSPRMPLMVAPSECGVDGITSLRVRTWTDVGTWIGAHSTPHQMHGCEQLDFNPSVDVELSSTRPDTPAGMDLRLSLPQGFNNPDGLEAPPLRDATVRLPVGVSINPAAADGLQACSDAQLGLGSGAEVACPEGSKIGSAVVRTPVLDEVVEGSVYVRSQSSSDPESGEMFRLALVLENEERGILVKLPGSVRADSETGRLEATFLDNPQLPVSEIEVSLKGGPRAPLALPTQCGEHRVEAELSAWSGHKVTRYASFDVDCAAERFAPAFDAGTMSPVGGSFSPLVAEIERRDGQAFLSDVDLDLPKGMLAKLAGVQLCPDSVASDGSAGSCPAGSRIGTATVGAGAGNPFYLQGGVYLTGPYRGGPYGLSVQVPVKAGPFDLGTVKVRQSIHVDPATAEIRVDSDRLPQIVSGVVARLRDVHVVADRPGFALNPTSCGSKQIDATLTAIDSQVHRTDRRFRAVDCRELSFEPRLALRLTGRRQVTTGKHPGVRAVVRQKGVGEAGIDRARVVLPKSLALDPDNAQALCEYPDGTRPDLEHHCPKGSIVGRAVARTPLLDRPLSGDVYFVKNVRRDPETGNGIRTLPMIIVALRGEIAINLRGESSTAKDGRLVNTFASVPDAPITRFDLNIAGGGNGILAVTRTRRTKINLCAQPNSHRAAVRMNGQNAARRTFQARVATPCAKAKTGKAGKRAKTGKRASR